MLVLWEQSYQESHYTYHIHENLPGLLMVMLRIALSGLFAYNLKFTIANEKSTLRQQFYHSFSFVRMLDYYLLLIYTLHYMQACYLWFLAFPVLMVIAMVFPQYWRHRVMLVYIITVYWPYPQGILQLATIEKSQSPLMLSFKILQGV